MAVNTDGSNSNMEVDQKRIWTNEMETSQVQAKTETETQSNGVINQITAKIRSTYNINRTAFKTVWYILLMLLYSAYFGYAMYYSFGDEGSIRLLAVTIFAAFIIVIKLTGDSYLYPCFNHIGDAIFSKNPQTKRKLIRWSMYVLSLVGVVLVIVFEVAMETPDNLLSLAGLAAFIVLCFVCSTSPGKVDWHPVYWGLVLQFLFAYIILRMEWGFQSFDWLGDRITEFMTHSDAGAQFVFDDHRAHFFAFTVMSQVVFFSSFISIMYYLGVIQAVVQVIGKVLWFCLGTTPAESLNAASNIFSGLTSAAQVVEPFLDTMTKSELHAVMTGGFATIAGGVMGAYIGFGVPANHLLSASVMSAPASLAVSKLLCPETEVTKATDDANYYVASKPQGRNLIEAASMGAADSIALVGSILVNLIAFLALLAFVNATLTWFGDRIGIELSFEMICSYLLYPVALFMGTDLQNCRQVAELVGIKTFTNEFIAYQALTEMLNNRKTWLNYTSVYNETGDWYWDGVDAVLPHWNTTLSRGFLTRRSEVISTYALCGFSNFGSIGIYLGGLSILAPNKKSVLAQIVFRCMIAGNIACFLTACIAGLFFKDYE